MSVRRADGLSKAKNWALRAGTLFRQALMNRKKTTVGRCAPERPPVADMNGLAIRPNRRDEAAAGFEIAFITDNPLTAYSAAIAAGAKAMGQTVSGVLCMVPQILGKLRPLREVSDCPGNL
jgi:hypothetical protein